jgi:cytidylate kinase
VTAAPVIVAIDGPSGVGKSTVARAVASRLGVPYLDTGAMYRAIGLRVREAGIDPGDAEAVGQAAAAADIELRREADGRFTVLLDGEDPGERLRAQEVSDATSRISAYPAIRSRMVALQRACASTHGGVVEGRDIGTKVFPATPHKFFLEARSDVRFRRRHEQLEARGQRVPLQAVEAEITARDDRDRSRADSPLACDASYTRIDTSDLTPAQVVDRIVNAVRAIR